MRPVNKTLRTLNQRRLLDMLKCNNTDRAILELDNKGKDYVASVGQYLFYKGTITPAQRSSVISFISTYTSTRCTIDDKPRIAKIERTTTTRKAVKHNFDNLEVLATRDLPIAQTTKHLMRVHSYNDHSIVLSTRASGPLYKVHRPENYTVTTTQYAYVTLRKTAHKGYLTIEAV